MNLVAFYQFFEAPPIDFSSKKAFSFNYFI